MPLPWSPLVSFVRPRRLASAVPFGLSLAWVAAFGCAEPPADACGRGTLACECHPDGSCEFGLACEGTICVHPGGTTEADPSGATVDDSSGAADDEGSSSTDPPPGVDESGDDSGEGSTGDPIPGDCMGPPPMQTCADPSPFIVEGDCDPYQQDCPSGERCVPWADDGGSMWNSTRCSDVAQAPRQLGETCHVEGSGVSGLDDCDVGLMCFDVDVDTGEGTCIELCGCGPEQPTCAGGGTTCVVSNGGALPICLRACDPLDPACDDDEVCVYGGSASDGMQRPFFCAPDASGTGTGIGDPCNALNGCPEGLFCASHDAGGCAGEGACCVQLCDLADDEVQCPLFGPECLPIYAEGEAPEACLDDVGACLVPPD